MADRSGRLDYRATSDAALQAGADRGAAELLGRRRPYELWERQQWAVQALDFTQDRADWHERMDDEDRLQRVFGQLPAAA